MEQVIPFTSIYKTAQAIKYRERERERERERKKELQIFTKTRVNQDRYFGKMTVSKKELFLRSCDVYHIKV